MSPLAAVPGSLLRRSRKKKGQAAAAGLVEPDSHMLIHYKKNIHGQAAAYHPHHITLSYMKRRSENKRVTCARLCVPAPMHFYPPFGVCMEFPCACAYLSS